MKRWLTTTMVLALAAGGTLPVLGQSLDETELRGENIRLREEPADDAAELAVLQGGAEVDITGEPVLVEGHAWWPVTVVDSEDKILTVDSQRMDPLGEQILTERADKRAVRLVDEAAGLAPGQHEDPILGIDGHSHHVAVTITPGQLFPAGNDVIARGHSRISRRHHH